MLIVRLLLAGLAGFSEGAAMGAEVLRFPALVQNSVVVLVWWGVLVPFICALKPPNERCPSRLLPVLLAGVTKEARLRESRFCLQVRVHPVELLLRSGQRAPAEHARRRRRLPRYTPTFRSQRHQRCTVLYCILQSKHFLSLGFSG